MHEILNYPDKSPFNTDYWRASHSQFHALFFFAAYKWNNMLVLCLSLVSHRHHAGSEEKGQAHRGRGGYVRQDPDVASTRCVQWRVRQAVHQQC